jgi:hypothetical protein
VTLGLPEHFELAGGNPESDLAWYYEVVTTSVIASPGGFWLVLSLSLKDVPAQYEVVKAYTFPTKVINNTYAELYLEKPYLALNLALNTRLDLSEADWSICKEHDEFMICPADKAVMYREFKACLLSLYLQAKEAPQLCERRMHAVPPAPFLIRHGSEIVFYTPEPYRVFFRCKRQNRWQTDARSLQGSGLIKGASACHVSTDQLQLRPVLREQSIFNSPTQLLYTQLLNPEEELQAVKWFINTSYFTKVAASPGVHLSLADVTARYGIGETADPGTRGTPWCLAVLTSVVTTSCLFTAYQLMCYIPRRAHKPRAHSIPLTDIEASNDKNRPVESSEPSEEPEGTTEPTPTTRFLKKVTYAPQPSD